MDFVSLVLSAALFYAFVPGVIGYFPRGEGKATVLLVHAILFALTVSVVMGFYWGKMRQYIERMSNWGDKCPNGFIEKLGKAGKVDCVPVGHRTY
jgi:hypothetical protein